MQRIARIQNTMPLELGFFIAALSAVNASLLIGRVCEPLVFIPEQLAMGQWWRAVTFPLVHVSLYHLLLDASAFLLLYYGLREIPLLRRWSYVACTAVGSLLAAVLLSPLDGGLCGLSGIAHGLMVISGLQLTRAPDASIRNAGWICVTVIVLKSLIELAMGRVLFSFLHVGSVGAPVAATHFGGVCGAMTVYALSHVHVRKNSEVRHD